ncbi:artemin [Dunckerocampus dactyliophorus]|uniref:artemin n=1 Tax=Dunckerocampus dactyliophorus TaxID=161453 RepID=UPI00240650CE|nr:artemin [Dunckerocampus dactyliophorus]XP_054624944.1 artemin [Dunckerocampus dactyliophorus]XP_054624945.1 artemin [Dunckerocampus dactyliophorus]
MTHRSGWIGLVMTRRGTCASPGPSCARLWRTSGGSRWRSRRKAGRETTSVMSAKVLLWVLLSVLPLVDGARVKANMGAAGVGAGSGHITGLLGGQEGLELPVTLPELTEDEEQGVDSDPYSPWHSFYDPFVIDEVDDHPSTRWAGRMPRSSDPTEPQLKGSPKKKKKRKKKEQEEEADGAGRGKNKQPKHSSRDCRVEKREMKVRDLGLGFDSDEIVLFKFCVGSCQSSRTNYDLALKALLENGSLPRRTSRKVSSHPCCRPDRYEPVSFMDAQTTWRTIQSLSAASCMCMG